MKKQELIEKINAIPWDEGLVVDTLKINRAGLLQLIEQLDEPQKVTIPQFVADWIEVCKEHLTSSLYLAMTPSFLKTNNQGIELTVWIKKNEETFALAWINGYEVEKEKRYRVKMKGIDKTSYLNHDILKKTWFFSIEHDGFTVRTHHTRKELEDAGFGEVFNSPLFEVEEVE
jgi:hypothetical protein